MNKEKAPKKVKGISISHEGRVGNCPNCNYFVTEFEDKDECKKCRQKLVWGEGTIPELIEVNKENLMEIIEVMYATGGMCNVGVCLDDDEPCEVCPFHERDLDMYKKNVIAYLTNDTC